MNTAALTHFYAHRAVAVLAGACALSVFFYATFLLLTVTHAASQTAVERQIQKLSTEVGEMETRYLIATKDITPDKALALGFTNPTQGQISTIVVTGGALSLSLR